MPNHPSRCYICATRFATPKAIEDPAVKHHARPVVLFVIPQKWHRLLTGRLGLLKMAYCLDTKVMVCYSCNEAVVNYFTDQERILHLNTPRRLRMALQNLEWVQTRTDKSFSVKKLARFEWTGDKVDQFKYKYFGMTDDGLWEDDNALDLEGFTSRSEVMEMFRQQLIENGTTLEGHREQLDAELKEHQNLMEARVERVQDSEKALRDEVTLLRRELVQLKGAAIGPANGDASGIISTAASDKVNRKMKKLKEQNKLLRQKMGQAFELIEEQKEAQSKLDRIVTMRLLGSQMKIDTVKQQIKTQKRAISDLESSRWDEGSGDRRRKKRRQRDTPALPSQQPGRPETGARQQAIALAATATASAAAISTRVQPQAPAAVIPAATVPAPAPTLPVVRPQAALAAVAAVPAASNVRPQAAAVVVRPQAAPPAARPQIASAAVSAVPIVASVRPQVAPTPAPAASTATGILSHRGAQAAPAVDPVQQPHQPRPPLAAPARRQRTESEALSELDIKTRESSPLDFRIYFEKEPRRYRGGSGTTLSSVPPEEEESEDELETTDATSDSEDRPPVKKANGTKTGYPTRPAMSEADFQTLCKQTGANIKAARAARDQLGSKGKGRAISPAAESTMSTSTDESGPLLPAHANTQLRSVAGAGGVNRSYANAKAGPSGTTGPYAAAKTLQSSHVPAVANTSQLPPSSRKALAIPEVAPVPTRSKRPRRSNASKVSYAESAL